MTQGDFIMVPFIWVKTLLLLTGITGAGMGIFSFLYPEQSVRLYQWMMLRFHWRVEPLHPEREIRNTRAMGFVMSGLSFTILILIVWNPAGYW